ncbi:MAG: UDP-N-acetylmuramoyl-L-alanyl-D-glutamate--2,6-diaminopimelate ligase, partial [Desulfobacterales bacterium]|nr:UDP-N-acetylmuramoyl-L-alanyl-D-glutamate--2,6-diaminopimelate ligase [Desulfobacterales bacterium]
NYRFLGKTHSAPVTTPESLDLMRFLREMADAGVTDVILEVSSHALDQKRTGECPFK